jgi:Zn-dependent M28 family amino/carboxypeptidase
MIDQLISPRRAWTRVLLVGLAMLLIATLLPGAAAEAGSGKSGKGNACDNRNNNTYQKLLDCMTLEGVREHQKAFQQIADNNDDEFYPGSRAAGTEGYQDSVDYVARKLERAGYTVTLDPVDFQFVFPAVLEQTAPEQVVYETGTFTGSGDGDVTGPTIAVDIDLTPPIESTSGCEPTDFDGLDFSGDADIAVIQRGACNFSVKAFNAQEAGAEAVVIFNTGDVPTNEGLIVGTLGDDSGVTIPVVGASFADGQELAEADEAHVRVLPSETRTDYNVIAEKRGTNDDNVVMAGAHLDSVTAGPGINDNGSGSAALLETALLMRKVKPQNTIRFAWWAAEELGLLGSADYVRGLSPEELDRIALYQNYDMVGSPNYIFMIYDADESTFLAEDFGVVVPEGSTAIEDLYEQFYTWKGEPYDDTGFSGRSDYEEFILNGIPSGGLFTGAEVVKTETQEEIWGGEAGAQFDPCYHEACDTYENNNDHALEVNSDLIAFSMLTYAYSTEDVNGVPGKRVPGKPIRLPEPAGPEGTFAETDGGGGPEHGQS